MSQKSKRGDSSLVSADGCSVAGLMWSWAWCFVVVG
jgi:hypothetical protein